MKKWELVTKKYDYDKPDHIRSTEFPYKVCDFNGISNHDKKMDRAKKIVLLQNFLVDNADRMQELSNIIRGHLSYGEYGSLSAELDSYLSELNQIMEDTDAND